MKKRILATIIALCLCLDLAAAAGSSEARAQMPADKKFGKVLNTEGNDHPYAYLGLQDMPICNYLDALSAFHYYMVDNVYSDGYVTEEIHVTDGIYSYTENEDMRAWMVDGYYLSIDKSTGSITEMEIDPAVQEQSRKYIEEIKEKGIPELSSKEFRGTGKGRIPLYSYTGDTDEYEYYEYFTDFSSYTLAERYYMKDGDVFAIWNKTESDLTETESTRVIKVMTGEIPEGIFDLPGHEKTDSSNVLADEPENTGPEKEQEKEESAKEEPEEEEPAEEEIAGEGPEGQIILPDDLAEEGGIVAAENGVTIEFTPGLNVPDNAALTISMQEPVTDDEMGASYVAFDISMGDVHDLGGFVSIRIPYDDSTMDAGQNPAGCVAGMYFNEESGEWEGVLYYVDTDAEELVIYTDHFSTYGCFVFRNEGKRTARVTYIHEWMLDVDESQLAKALKEIVDNEGTPGVECRELLRPALENSFEELASLISNTDDKATVAGNLTTLFISGTGLGEIVGNTEWANSLTSALGYAGISIAVVSLAAQAAKTDKTRNDIFGMYKSAMYLLVSLSQSATLGTIGASVWVIDKGLTDIGEYAYNKISDDTTKAYRHYYSKYMTRSKTDWRWTLKDVARNTAKNQESADSAIMDEIDRWCGLFWDIDNDTYSNILIDIDQKGRGWPDEDTKTAITASYKGDLLRMLEPILEEVHNDLEMELWREMQKRLDEFRGKLNSILTFEISEDLKDGKKESQYAGFTVALGPLSDGAVKSDWQSVMNANGKSELKCTLIAWLLAGQPTEIRLYGPGKDPEKDQPEKTISFQMTAPKAVIPLGESTEEAQEEQVDIWEIDREVLKENGYYVDLIRDSGTLYLYEGIINAEKGSLVRLISASNSDKGSVIIIYYFETEEQAAACYEKLIADAPYAYRREGTRVVKDDQDSLIK